VASDDPTLEGSGEPEEADMGARWVVGRYELDGLIGRGGAGKVYAAWDRRTAERVAVKLVAAHRASLGPQVRRELVALRLLRLPGVVRLLDDGEDRGQTFLVTELLPGGPFTGPGGWDRWGERVVALLRTLARVHLAGVVHRDLKPSNVLLDGRGDPVITDFGLARGRRIEDPAPGWIEGTPRYMSPEQRRGEPCDARTDLYAVGVMLGELVGREAPAAVRALATALRAHDAADRPGSAWEALEAIGVRRPEVLPADLPDPATAEDVARRVLGEPPVAFLRTERDAAQLLVARTGGRRARLRAELDSWVRSGIAADVDVGVRVDPVALRQLQLTDEAWFRAVIAAPSPAVEALGAVDALVGQGALERAFALLEAVLPTARDDRALLVAVVRAMARVALDLDLAGALDHAVAAARDADEAAICDLLGAARAAAGQDRARARALVPQAPFADEELENHRVGTSALAAEDSAAYLAEVAGWAHTPRRWAKWLGWRGNAAFRDRAYALAADLHERSAEAKELPHERVNSWSNAAAAHLELGAFDHAAAQADRAAAEAAAHGLASFAARAAILARHARYRGGAEWDADRAWVDAARPFGPYLVAVAALTEASVGWRCGHADAAGLAEEAAVGFRAAGNARLTALADALQIALGAPVDPAGCLAFAAAAAPGDANARTALQIFGLVAPAVTVDPAPVARLAGALPPGSRDLRLDILSVGEVEARVATRC
jgi:hypothetical protein